jgi:hypothetical protein
VVVVEEELVVVLLALEAVAVVLVAVTMRWMEVDKMVVEDHHRSVTRGKILWIIDQEEESAVLVLVEVEVETLAVVVVTRSAVLADRHVQGLAVVSAALAVAGAQVALVVVDLHLDSREVLPAEAVVLVDRLVVAPATLVRPLRQVVLDLQHLDLLAVHQVGVVVEPVPHLVVVPRRQLPVDHHHLGLQVAHPAGAIVDPLLDLPVARRAAEVPVDLHLDLRAVHRAAAAAAVVLVLVPVRLESHLLDHHHLPVARSVAWVAAVVRHPLFLHHRHLLHQVSVVDHQVKTEVTAASVHLDRWVVVVVLRVSVEDLVVQAAVVVVVSVVVQTDLELLVVATITATVLD